MLNVVCMQVGTLLLPQQYSASLLSVLGGSGGGLVNGTNLVGGFAGGMIYLSCPGCPVSLVSGSLIADGEAPPATGGNWGGSGSGGSVGIWCAVFTSSSGVISVMGGNSYNATTGAGGGGRISITAVSFVVSA